MANDKIKGTTEAWEDGQLGRDERYVKKVELDSKVIDDSLELQLISIRMQKGLLEDLKNIAQLRGLGYQPLIKQILKRFVDSEMKLILKELALEEAKRELEESAEKRELRRA